MQVASGEEVKKLLSDYGLTLDKLPKIRVTDPSLIPLGPKVGDVIKITRVSPATGKDALYYRLVVD
jgi:DNA-directed RNA polymerase subunit H (RpoH/RPB5)